MVLDAKPSTWVERHLSLLQKHQGPILDLACGAGRHTKLLLNAGLEVVALDRNLEHLHHLENWGRKRFVAI